MAHCSLPIADFRAAYIGSRSIRAGIIWLVLMGFAAVDGVETVIVLLERVGVVRLTAGRDDRSAGLMSGILGDGVVDYVCTCTALRCDAELRAVGGGPTGSPATSRAGYLRTATRQTRS